MSYSKCLVGNTFIAQCKEKTNCVKVRTPFKYFRIRLKNKAYCGIKKDINQTLEGYIVRKLKRAFTEVITEREKGLSTSLGELRCDFCNSPPNIKNRKHPKHIQPFFNINRILEHPLICFENHITEHEPYAEIEPNIFSD